MTNSRAYILIVTCIIPSSPLVDWVLPEVLCVKQGGFGGRAKYILKDALRFLPLYGWYLGMVSGQVGRSLELSD